MPRMRFPRILLSRRVLFTVVCVVVCATGWWAYHEYARAMDRKDLRALTRGSPWPWRELRVPDGLPADDEVTRNAASVTDLGFEVTFPVTTPDGHEIMVTYRIHDPPDGVSLPRGPQPDAGLPYGPHCGADLILTCVPTADGITKVITHDTSNSDPSLALFQIRRGRMFSVRGYDGPADVAQLRRLLTRTHRPGFDELLHLLRPRGYEREVWLG